MKKWIARWTRLVGGILFFLLFFLSFDYEHPWEWQSILLALGKACLGTGIAWTAFFIIADIALKGIFEDIDSESVDILDEGFLYHIREEKLHPSEEIIMKPQTGGESSAAALSSSAVPHREE